MHQGDKSMSKLCGKCGAPLHDGAGFCGSCGASAQQAASPSSQSEFQPVSQPVTLAATPQPEFQPMSQPVAPAATPPPVAAALPVPPHPTTTMTIFSQGLELFAAATGGG